jgi:hypothetical protein
MSNVVEDAKNWNAIKEHIIRLRNVAHGDAYSLHDMILAANNLISEFSKIDQKNKCFVCNLHDCLNRDKCQLAYFSVISREGHTKSYYLPGCTSNCVGCRAEQKIKEIKERNKDL